MKKPSKPAQEQLSEKSRHPGLAKQNRPATALEVRERIKMLVSLNGTLLAVSIDTGISVGYLHQVLHGKRRASNKVLAALGLPCYSPALVCPKHGVVHRGQCPKNIKPPKSLFDWPIRQLARAIRERKEMG